VRSGAGHQLLAGQVCAALTVCDAASKDMVAALMAGDLPQAQQEAERIARQAETAKTLAAALAHIIADHRRREPLKGAA
jgi:hypothetical protein